MKQLASLVIAPALDSSMAMAQSGHVQRRFTFAQTNCAQCHAIVGFGNSPIPEAPPFRRLHTRYAIGDLAEAFTAGHLSMPQFRLEPAHTKDLLTYPQSLQGSLACCRSPDRQAESVSSTSFSALLPERPIPLGLSCLFQGSAVEPLDGSTPVLDAIVRLGS
ncbi:hypothetical protein [Microvirga sp. P5_D2]